MFRFKLFLFTLVLSSTLVAQDFEGIITYGISYELSPEMKPYESMLPKSSKMEYRDKVSRTTVETAATGGSTVVIADNENKEVLTLMNNGMQKVALRSKFEGDDSEEPDYTKTGEKKEIAGYGCEVMEAEVEQSILRVCVTQDLPNIHTDNARGIDGFPLEITIETDQMTTTQTVTEIVEGSVPKLKLEVPSGYKEMSLEEYQKSMMQMGQ
jgi:hypothetical protein